MEPFRTIRKRPWRFAIGIPIVMLVGLLLFFTAESLSRGLAMGLQIGFQGAGYFLLYTSARRSVSNEPHA